MSKQEITAALILIGNEILSGRTQDKNLSYIAQGLEKVGVRLREVRVIPDIEETIIATTQTLAKAHDHVFTTGGIGPTHDDITSASIAKAFNRPLIIHPDAKLALQNYYHDTLTESRLQMAHVPEGATLIPNPISGAPGFTIENVSVMAGIPNIMQAMFDYVVGTIAHGDLLHTQELSAYVSESAIAKELAAIQSRFPMIEIGSYPFVQNNKIGTSLVMRTTDSKALSACAEELTALLKTYEC